MTCNIILRLAIKFPTLYEWWSNALPPGQKRRQKTGVYRRGVGGCWSFDLTGTQDLGFYNWSLGNHDENFPVTWTKFLWKSSFTNKFPSQQHSFCLVYLQLQCTVTHFGRFLNFIPVNWAEIIPYEQTTKIPPSIQANPLIGLILTSLECSVLRLLPWAILQFSAQWPGLWMEARLKVTLFWYRPPCFCCVNQVVLILPNWDLNEKAGLYQSKVNSSLTTIQRPGNWAHNCKMTYRPKLRGQFCLPGLIK